MNDGAAAPPPQPGGVAVPGRCSVVWFKRDLRVEDHEPLARAASRGPVIGLYVYEPEVVGAAEHDPSHVVFVNDCLVSVRSGLRALGTDLLVRRGRMPDVLDRLHADLPFDELWSHEETGLLATFDRDKRVRAWCRRRGVRWTELAQHGVFRPVGTRDGWAARWTRRMAEPPRPSPARVSGPPAGVLARLGMGELLGPESLGLPASSRRLAPRGGAGEGAALLRSFLETRGEHYQSAMSSPVEGWDACSRLSPYLAYGAVSVRTAHHAARRRLDALQREDAGRAWRRSVASFDKRLRWRCHFAQKLEDEPEIEFRNFNRAYDGLRTEDPADWTDAEHARFDAWREGRTGYPMVDACMRCLACTGWINFRMRAMLVSFAAYHLWLHWKPVAIELAKRFLDFEPGVHYPQCQMQSGVTGINTVRIYSPIKQAADQDPHGVFIRRWVPELAGAPDEHLARPGLMHPLTQRLAGCVVGEDYPAPIVDHATAYAEAKRRIYARRSAPEARAEAKRVYRRHGSRRRPTARGPRGRRPADDRGGAVD